MLCQAICLSFVKMLRDGKRLLGMPMSLAVLTRREKNWRNQRSSLHQDELAGSELLLNLDGDCAVRKSEGAKL